MPPVLIPLTPHNSHGTSPDLPPGSQAGARPGDKGQLGGEGKGIPVPSSPEAQDFLGSVSDLGHTQDSEAQAC